MHRHDTYCPAMQSGYPEGTDTSQSRCNWYAVAPFATMETEGAKGQALTEIGQAPANGSWDFSL